MKTLKEEAKEYAKELIEARVIEDHQSGWMESVYLYITRKPALTVNHTGVKYNASS